MIIIWHEPFALSPPDFKLTHYRAEMIVIGAGR